MGAVPAARSGDHGRFGLHSRHPAGRRGARQPHRQLHGGPGKAPHGPVHGDNRAATVRERFHVKIRTTNLMKSFLFFLFTAAVWAQSAAPQATAPSSAPPALSPDTVVATFEDGLNLTAGELSSFLTVMPPNMQQAPRRNRKAFVQQVALMHRLPAMAEKAKLDQQGPPRVALAFTRMSLLMNARLREVLTTINVASAEAQSF